MDQSLIADIIELLETAERDRMKATLSTDEWEDLKNRTLERLGHNSA